MIHAFSNVVKQKLAANPARKYYVYRLVDPRTYQTFYVGKGCDDRVFEHAKAAANLIAKGEDAVSLKFKQIKDIMSAGKDVICIIHRRGLSEKTAFEVEAALIDAYPGLTNIQKGHDYERGVISAEDLEKSYSLGVYTEPADDYVIIKTTPAAISANGNLYEATRRCWNASLKYARRYKYVLSVIYGIVQEVYEVDRWYTYDASGRIAFEGKPTNASVASLKGMRIPDYYRKPHMANPFLYKKRK